MKIGFEAKRFFHNFTGLGNYSRFVISALAKTYPSDELYLFSPKLRKHREIDEIIANQNVHAIQPPSLFRKPVLNSVWRSWGVSFNPVVKDLDVYHGLSQELPAGLPQKLMKVVTVHDLIFLRYPQFYNPIDVKIYHAKVRRACLAADKIVAISEQTASDVRDFLNIPPEKISVVYQGVHPNFRATVTASEIDDVKQAHQLPKRYLLNVGTIEERKNTGIIVKAMASIPKDQRLPLVIVGKATKYMDKVMTLVHKHNVAGDVMFRHNIPFADFPALYQGSDLFLYPSLFEGFGIPLVEAIMSRVPVITSTGSCFREAAGPDAIYVDAHEEGEMAKAIMTVTSDRNYRDQMVTASLNYIKRFEPEVIAGNLMKLYSGT